MFDYHQYMHKYAPTSNHLNYALNILSICRYTTGKSSINSGLENVFNKLVFEASAGARLNARKVVVVFSENSLNVDAKMYWNDISDHRGVKIMFINAKTNRKPREILPKMYMENMDTLKELGNLLGTGNTCNVCYS